MGGNEINLFEEEAHGENSSSFAWGTTCCVKSLGTLEGGDPLSITTPKCAKITGRVWEAADLQAMHERWLMPPLAFFCIIVTYFKI